VIKATALAEFLLRPQAKAQIGAFYQITQLLYNDYLFDARILIFLSAINCPDFY